MECNQIRCVFACNCLYGDRYYAGYGKISRTGQMANAASIARRIVFTRRRGHLAVKHLMFAHIHGFVRLVHFMASALRQLHGYRCRQCTTGKNRQPKQHQYSNEFSGRTGHEPSLSKWREIVNRPAIGHCSLDKEISIVSTPRWG